ncbi:MAG: hypothetical protein ACRCUF_08905 [Aeromonas sobria]
MTEDQKLLALHRHEANRHRLLGHPATQKAHEDKANRVEEWLKKN